MAETDKPQIIIDSSVEPAIARRITAIDRAIDRNPEAFTAAMVSLGSQATAHVIELSDIDQRIPTATRKPEELIKEFLGNRYDYNTWYDDATEDALLDDAEHLRLRNEATNKKSVTVKKGQMTSAVRPHPEAEDARDQLRRYRFGFYLSRVLDYKNQGSHLESAV